VSLLAALLGSASDAGACEMRLDIPGVDGNDGCNTA
jgi:hypothetical protein